MNRAKYINNNNNNNKHNMNSNIKMLHYLYLPLLKMTHSLYLYTVITYIDATINESIEITALIDTGAGVIKGYKY